MAEAVPAGGGPVNYLPDEANASNSLLIILHAFAELVSLATKNVSDIERGVVGISIGTLIRKQYQREGGR